ncbi:MAG TPA: IclR family transcriptional regulator C-terminal domain-containing protein, partial [Mycobacterium sp.]
VGKLLLAEKRDVDALLTSPLHALTQRTVTSRSALAEQFDAIRDQGVAAQTGELRVGTACVAVPVRAPAGALVAALAMSGRAEQDELLQRQIHTLVECATQLSPLLA